MRRSKVTVHWIAMPAARDAGDAVLARLQSVRVGFPNAGITVYTHIAELDAALNITASAQSLGCTVRSYALATRHYAVLADIVMDPAHDGTHVIVDSRVQFWSDCEGWSVTGHIAGRLVPSILDDRRGCISMARLHPSMLWVPDAGTLRTRIARDFRFSELGGLDAFAPYRFRDITSGMWYRFATAANLYAALREDAEAFSPDQLDAFDRVHADGLAHVAADQLRGSWRAQDEYFRSRAVPSAAELVFAR